MWDEMMAWPLLGASMEMMSDDLLSENLLEQG
jgi:hypothetical protein